MTLFLDDGDVRLYHGDALETVRQLPDDSVDCVVTSPPYWGLRDYGTGEWDGGDPDCDHKAAAPSSEPDQGKERSASLQAQGRDKSNRSPLGPGQHGGWEGRASRSDGSRVCRCGARRVDRQMGLEPTPELFVQGMVELFREIRRVLAPHGTCWVNLGDCYWSDPSGSAGGSDDLTWSVRGAEQYGRRKRPKHSTLKQKDLAGMPWRVAFALQADGWWLRSDIIWAKPNPMPESVTDRPTKAHEYVFLLTKSPRYWFDTEAVREPNDTTQKRPGYTAIVDNRTSEKYGAGMESRRERHGDNGYINPAGRNVRSVWQIATQPYPEAHFATYPEELARRCILAGCPIRVCRVCGKPSERIVDVDYEEAGKNNNSLKTKGGGDADAAMSARPYETRMLKHVTTTGWSDCGHNNWRPGQVLDPFIGSGTTAKVARDHQRHAIGIDLNHEYLELAARRLQQLSLLNAT